MSICWKILKIVANFPKGSNENLQFLKKYGIIKWECVNQRLTRMRPGAPRTIICRVAMGRGEPSV